MQRAQTAGRTIDAIDYERLNDVDRAVLKPTLSCVTCGHWAFFVRRSRDGRAAHFSAQHEQGCDDASGWEETSRTDGELTEAPAIWNEGADLVLRRDPQRPPSQVDGSTGAGGGSSAGITHVSSRGEEKTRARSIGMSKLLLRLRTEPELSRSEGVLVLHDGTRTTIGAGCAPASRFEHSEGRSQILWGLIAAASSGGRTLWINTGPKGSDRPAVLVRSKHVTEVLDAAGVTELEELRGRWFIVEGVFKLTVNNAPYCTLEEPSALHIAAG